MDQFSEVGGDESTQVNDLQHKIDLLRDRDCVDCGRVICGHDAILCVALGCQDRPHCLSCLAVLFQEAEHDLGDRVWAHIQRKDCFRTAWERVSQQERTTTKSPRCLWQDVTPELSDKSSSPEHAQPGKEVGRVDAEWDAGDMACGDLVLALRLRMNALPGSGVLKLVALDAAAPEDIPAWCRLTGHKLLGFKHPEYLIQRKEV